MVKYLGLFLVGLSCLSCSEPAAVKTENNQTVTPSDSIFEPAASQQTAFQIIPGQRIGQVAVGENPEKVFEALGEADAGDAAMGKALSTWYSQDSGQRRELNVYTVTKKTGTPQQTVGVEQVRITSPAYTVAETDISVGSTLPQIRKHFPQARPIAYVEQEQQKIIVYDAPAQGIAFEIAGPDSSCVGITVHPTGSGAADAYLPIHPNLVRLKQ